MAENTTEHTEHDETTENPETAPEMGEGNGDDTSESAPGTDTTAQHEQGENAGEGEDWEAKAQLYKVHMRANEKDLKAARKERDALQKELEQLRAGAATAPQEDKPTTEGNDQQPDPVAARMEELAAQIAEVRQEADQLRQSNAEAARAKMVAEVAADKGLNVAQASRLRGDTREELEADADEVKELFGLTKPKSPGPAPKPKERRPQRGGATNPDDTDGRSREDVLAAVLSNGRRVKA